MEPSAVVSSYNARYYMCFLDYYTNFICLFPLKHISKVENNFFLFQNYVQRHFDSKIKVVQTDYGCKYHHLNNYFKSCGIEYCIACFYTH